MLPILLELAADGSAGVACVCEIMRDELEINMGLCGRTKIADLTPDLIFRADTQLRSPPKQARSSQGHASCARIASKESPARPRARSRSHIPTRV